MWIRMGHFISRLGPVLRRGREGQLGRPGERGEGQGSAYVFPLVVLLAGLGGAIFAWSQQSVAVQSAILSIGWPVLYLITVPRPCSC